MDTRRTFLKKLGLGFCSVAAGKYAFGMGAVKRDLSNNRPNVILILSDDQGYGDFGCYGNDIIKTPNMDALYKQSTRFTNFYVCPVCSPTRASLMTGRYNYRTGVWDTWKARVNMHNDENTIPEVLKKAGYKTGIFGKWHLGYNYPMRAMDQGFEQAYTFFGAKSRFDPLMDLNGKKIRVKGYLDDIIFDKAIEFVEQNRDKPFFAYIPSFSPHYFPAKQVPDEDVKIYQSQKNLSQGDKEVYAMVTRLDRNLGRLLDTLKRLDIQKNTVVIFLSDNGPQLKSHNEPNSNHPYRYNLGLRGGKGEVYEGGIKVPCFVRWPGVVKAGRDIDTIAAHIDMLPTIADICKAPLPKDKKIDGLDLVPLLKNEKVHWPDRCLFAQFYRTASPEMWRNCSVRDQRYKLVDGSELYDLKKDPGEKKDIAKEHPDIVADLRAKYEKWFNEVTTERGFVAERTILGSPSQKHLRLKYWNRNTSGWPIKVVNPGPYKFSVTEIRHSLISKDASLKIKVGDKTFTKKINENDADVVIDNMLLDKGICYIQIWIEGMVKKSIMLYGDEDPGFRNIYIDQK